MTSHLIGHEVLIGTHGFIQLVDVMGSDLRIVDAARISFGGGQYESHEKNRNLIRYLMRNRHTSPFEQCELTFIICCPMDVWRQWIRHRTANVNEYSTRYTKALEATATTEADSWRLQDQSNRQGSAIDMVPSDRGEALSSKEAQLHKLMREVYQERLDAITFTGPEIRALTRLLFDGRSLEHGFKRDHTLSDREVHELNAKMNRFYQGAQD